MPPNPPGSDATDEERAYPPAPPLSPGQYVAACLTLAYLAEHRPALKDLIIDPDNTEPAVLDRPIAD